MHAPPASRQPARLSPAWLAIALLPLLSSCGGSGGPGGGGGGGGGGGPPTGSFLSVEGLRYLRPGDRLVVRFIADDAGTSQVRLVLDADGDANTTGDQVALFGPQPDASGAIREVAVTIPNGTAIDMYELLLLADDGVNPMLVVAWLRQIVVMPGLAGLAPGAGSNRYAVVLDKVYFSRSEASDGNQAFNGDGSDGDAVVASYNTSTNGLVQSTVTVEKTAFNGGESVVLPIESGVSVGWTHLEQDAFVDGDGDGTLNDRNGAMWLAVAPLPRGNMAGGLDRLIDMRGGRLIASYAEANQGPGGTNRNVAGPVADFDAIDFFFAYIDPGVAATTDAALVYWPLAQGGNEFAVSASNQLVVFPVSEAQQGGGDLTGDGDAVDTVAALGTLAANGGAPGGTPAVLLGFAGAGPGILPRHIDSTARLAALGADVSAYVIPEAAGPGDVNGDGVVNGFVVAFYNSTTQVEVIPTAPSAGPVSAGPGARHLFFDGPRLFHTMQEGLRNEALIGTNNDGDGGLDNEILCFTNTSLGVGAPIVPVNVQGVLGMGGLRALALDGGSMEPLAPGWAGLEVQEGANGNLDINGNGAIDVAFLLMQTNSPGAPTIHNPQLRTTASSTIPGTGIGNGGGVLVRVLEFLNGGDLDNDGQLFETLFTYISFAAPTTPIFLDAGGDHAALGGGLIAVTANETLTSEDYDGNGDTFDFVFRVFDTSGAVQHEGTLSHAVSVPASDTGLAFAFLRNEAAEGRTLNADADTGDLVLGVYVP